MREIKFIIKNFWQLILIVMVLSAVATVSHFQKHEEVRAERVETQVSPEVEEVEQIEKELPKVEDIKIITEVEAKTVEKVSYYCEGFEGKQTANQEIYDCEARTCAHKSLPFGTMVEITADNGNVTTCRVNDRGPYVEGRIFDLSKSVFEELAPISKGVLTIKSWRIL